MFSHFKKKTQAGTVDQTAAHGRRVLMDVTPKQRSADPNTRTDSTWRAPRAPATFTTLESARAAHSQHADNTQTGHMTASPQCLQLEDTWTTMPQQLDNQGPLKLPYGCGIRGSCAALGVEFCFLVCARDNGTWSYMFSSPVSLQDPNLIWLNTSQHEVIPAFFIDRDAKFTLLFSHGNAEDFSM